MEKFEKNMQEKFYEFNIQPSGHVWERVNAELQEKKKRRFAFWWFPVAALMVIISGAMFFVLNNENHSNLAIHIQANETTKTINKEEQSTNNKTTTTDNEKSSITKSTESININSNANGNKQNIKYQIRKSVIKHISKLVIAKMNVDNASTIKSDSDEVNVTTSKQIKSSIVATVKKDSTIAKVSIKDTIKQKQDLTVITQTQKKQKKHQHKLFAITGGGLSMVKTGVFEGAGNIGGYTNTGTTTLPSQPSMPLPKTGFTFLGGVGYTRILNKHWALNTGSQYRYISNKQDVYFYSIVSAVPNVKKVHNYSHWLEIPIHIDYTINPSAKNKVSIFAGGSMAWAFAEKWLVTDAEKNTTYYNKNANSKLLINALLGLRVTLKNNYTISVVGQQSITPIHTDVKQKYYHQQYALQFGIPLKK